MPGVACPVLTGGLAAVIYTEVLQSAVMIIGSFVLMILSKYVLDCECDMAVVSLLVSLASVENLWQLNKHDNHDHNYL